MSDDPVGEIISVGRVGRFWEWREDGVTLDSRPMYGHLIQRGSEVEVTVSVADETGKTHPTFDPSVDGYTRSAPTALLGILEQETVILLNIGRRGPGHRWKAGHALTNTATYIATIVVANVYHLEDLRSYELRSASVVFPGMLRWAGLESIRQTRETNDLGIVTTGHIDLLPLPASTRGRTGSGLSVSIDVQWSVKEQSEQLSVSTGLLLKCSATTPRKSNDFVRVLSHLQLLIVLAYRRWIAPQPGWAELDRRGERSSRFAGREPAQFWAAELMSNHATEPTGTDSGIPYFDFRTMGGTAALARWVRLCEELPRVIDPLRMFYRNGVTTVYDHINATASAIEYWASSWKKRPGWERRLGDLKGGAGTLNVVARRVGREWDRYVGNSPKWADCVWEAYLSTKHYRPSARFFTNSELQIVAATLDLLLTTALVNEAAGSKRPAVAMLNHFSMRGLQDEVRKLIA